MKWILSVLALLAMIVVSSEAEAKNRRRTVDRSYIRCSPTVSWQPIYYVHCNPYTGCRISTGYSPRVVYSCRREYSNSIPIRISPIEMNPRPISVPIRLSPIEMNPHPIPYR